METSRKPEKYLKLKILFALLKTVHQRLHFSLAEFSAHFTNKIKMSIVNVRASHYIVCLNCISGQFVKTNISWTEVRSRSSLHTRLLTHKDCCLLDIMCTLQTWVHADIIQGHEHLNIAKIEKVPYLRILCYLRKH